MKVRMLLLWPEARNSSLTAYRLLALVAQQAAPVLMTNYVLPLILDILWPVLSTCRTHTLPELTSNTIRR